MSATKIAVIGMGYVGIPAAALLADVDSFEVIGIQRRSKRSGWRIEYLNEGKNPIGANEPGLSELIKRVVKEKKSFYVTDDYSILKNMDYILIDVQTPTDEMHIPRYESLREVSAQVGQYLRKGTTVIIESTCAPGTTNYVAKPIIEEKSGLIAGQDFHLVYSYERVMVGRLLYNIINYPRIIGGFTPACTKRGIWLYKHIVREKLLPTDPLTAEMAKVVENTYRDVNVAFANEVALACESMGVNVYEMRELVNSLPFNSNAYRDFHIPGAGVGGHCLPKDPWLLKYGVDTYGATHLDFHVVKASRLINRFMPEHAVALVVEALSKQGDSVPEKQIVAVLGAAFLENSDDTRNTPAVDIIRLLKERNYQVRIHDPHVKQRDFEYPLSANLEEVVSGADAIVLVTKHREYYDASLSQLGNLMRHRILVDGRNVWDAEEARKMGFLYVGVGKSRPF
ncbi:MAG: nucleotide sugar dehydrogenase [Candidatus Thorarchaeota archaeon]